MDKSLSETGGRKDELRMAIEDQRLFRHSLGERNTRYQVPRKKNGEFKGMTHKEYKRLLKKLPPEVQKDLKPNFMELFILNFGESYTSEYDNLSKQLRTIEIILERRGKLDNDLRKEIRNSYQKELKKRISKYEKDEIIIMQLYTKKHNMILNTLRDIITETLLSGDYTLLTKESVETRIEEYMIEFHNSIIDKYRKYVQKAEQLKREKIDRGYYHVSGVLDYFIKIMDDYYKGYKNVDERRLLTMLMVEDSYQGHMNEDYTKDEQTLIDYLNNKRIGAKEELDYLVEIDRGKPEGYTGNVLRFLNRDLDELRISPVSSVYRKWNDIKGEYESRLLAIRIGSEDMNHYLKAVHQHLKSYLEGTEVSEDSINYSIRLVRESYSGNDYIQDLM